MLEGLRRQIEGKKQQLAQAQVENARRMKESEEYKATNKAMEEPLGRSHISFNKIAEFILRLPTFSMQIEALQHFNFLLTETGWSTRAEEMMIRVFSQMRAEIFDVLKKVYVEYKNEVLERRKYK